MRTFYKALLALRPFLAVCALELFIWGIAPFCSLDGLTFPTSERSITIMLAQHDATEVALPYGSFKRLDVLLQCQGEEEMAAFADKTLI